MTQRTPWLRVFAEGAVIVISILLAFAIDAWWAQRQDRILERQYLERLSEDFDLGKLQLDFQHRRLSDALEASRALTTALDAPFHSMTDSALVEQFGTASRTGFVEAQLDHAATYQELQATGRIAILSDPAFRSALGAYYRGIEVLTQDILGMNRGANARYLQLTGRRASEIQGEPSLLTAAARGRILAEVRSNPDLAGELREFSGMATLVLGRIQTLHATNDSLAAANERF